MSELALPERQSHQALCPSIVVACSHASNGCPWAGPRSELASIHLPTCHYEALKGFFAVFSAKAQTLLDDNALLRRRVEALEGVASALKVENDVIKRALGPWYRPHTQEEAPFASTSWYTTEMVPGRSHPLSPPPPQRNRGDSTAIDTAPNPSPSTAPVHGGGSFNTHNSAPTNVSSSTRQHPTTDTSDITAYFPPADTEEPLFSEREIWDHGGDMLFSAQFSPSIVDSFGAEQLRSPSFGQAHLYHEPYIHGHFPSPIYLAPPATGQGPSSTPTSPPQVPAVAPLNISTSLHRTLISLRESIVTLNNAVESLTRRQDVALATEVMRTSEEIRSLRVVIHGLRIQVSFLVDTHDPSTIATVCTNLSLI